MKRVRSTAKWCLVIIAGLVALLAASDAWAWGPATHLHFGISALEQMSRLGDGVRALLSSQALPFLYGCVSADIVLAKKFGRAANHCHNWENGIRLIDEAKEPRTQAFSLGYVSHLAADTISHNCYVPSKSIESYDKGVLTHMYWELLFDQKVTSDKMINLFRQLAGMDFSDCDTHMEQLVPTRIFDFATNKRIFNRLLLLQSLNRYQKLWNGISQRSPWPLRKLEFLSFEYRAFQAVMSFLRDGRKSPFCEIDPTGRDRLRAAHKIRRYFRRCRRTADPPSSTEVMDAAAHFAKDPFRKILADELRAA